MCRLDVSLYVHQLCILYSLQHNLHRLLANSPAGSTYDRAVGSDQHAEISHLGLLM
uniref:AlNc14C35G3134 protein n=1 Tax=Albugo laibachii Nc14 TaxID=890382 RepID=F0W8K8_9STRA|nr:AlNc14C35G3134 [Albugo laibachii Nc14]|eukprot:CCA17463.1 AlNc14C35G3134 [Albugo laibachii Nc14]